MHCFVDVTIDNVQKRLSSLNIPKLVGQRRISAHFLEEASEVIATSHWYNQSVIKNWCCPKLFQS